MGDNERLRRENPARTAPLRNFNGIFRPESDLDPPQAPTSNGAASSAEPASRDDSVGLAYRVIEKHINEGKHNAGFFNREAYQTRPLTDGFQELLERTMRFQNEILPLWLEALGSAVSVAPGRTANGAAAPAPHAESNPAPGQDSRAISVEVASARPVQISLDLKEKSERLPLVTLGLRAVEQDASLAGEIIFTPETAEDPIRLRISIADSCSPGVYSGVVVNRLTGEVRGTLTVRVAQ